MECVGELWGTVIHRERECNVQVPPDSCLAQGSATRLADHLGVHQVFLGLMIYIPRPSDESSSGITQLRLAVGRLQRFGTGDGHPFYSIAKICANEQRGGVFNKSQVARCIYERVEGASFRSLVVLVGRDQTDLFYAELPMGLVINFTVQFFRIREQLLFKDTMTIIMQW